MFCCIVVCCSNKYFSVSVSRSDRTEILTAWFMGLLDIAIIVVGTFTNVQQTIQFKRLNTLGGAD